MESATIKRMSSSSPFDPHPSVVVLKKCAGFSHNSVPQVGGQIMSLRGAERRSNPGFSRLKIAAGSALAMTLFQSIRVIKPTLLLRIPTIIQLREGTVVSLSMRGVKHRNNPVIQGHGLLRFPRTDGFFPTRDRPDLLPNKMGLTDACAFNRSHNRVIRLFGARLRCKRTHMEHKPYKPMEAARILGVSKDVLLAYERDGKIPEAHRDALGNRYYTGTDIEIIRDLMNVRPALTNRPLVLAVFNMKGGVGKSTISSNVAWKMAEKGFRTLAIDADPQGHMTTSLGQEPSRFEKTFLHLLIPDSKRETSMVGSVGRELLPNLHLVPANLSMCSMNLLLFQQPEREYRFRRAVEEIRTESFYDVVVVDSPPSYDLTSLNILLSCDMLLVPVRLDGNSFYGLEYLFDSIRDIARTYRYAISKIAIVANHYNGGYSVSRQILEGLRHNYAPYMMSTVVRQDVNFDKANALRQPVFVMAPASKGSKDMERLVDEIVEKIEIKECWARSAHEQEKT